MIVEIVKKKEVLNKRIESGFVVCGDIHLYNNYPYNNNTDIISSRLMDAASALDEAASVANRFGLKLILNGDIITSGIFDFPVEKVFTDFLLKFKNLDIIINLGNHDLDGENSVITPLVRLSGNKKHIVITEPTTIIDGDYYHFIPYYNEAKTISKLNESISKISETRKNVLFMHHSFKNSLFTNNSRITSGINQEYFIDGGFSKYDIIVASHIHKYQELFGGKGFYTSSLIPINFGEKSKEHGYHVVDISSNKRYFVIPKAPRFIKIKASDIGKKDIKKKAKNNIVMIINDDEKEYNKEETRNKIIELGARFVSFNNKIKKSKYSETINKISTNKAESIISEYSKIIAEKSSLKNKRLEGIGLEFLEKARKEIAIESQRR